MDTLSSCPGFYVLTLNLPVKMTGLVLLPNLQGPLVLVFTYTLLSYVGNFV